MRDERCLIEAVDRLIREVYGKPVAVGEEVLTPSRQGWIDLVYLYEGEPYVVAVELKIWDWKTGFKQALRNTLYAKYSYLAIQWKRRRQIDLDLFREFGIGLIAVNGKTAKIIVEPKESKRFEEHKQEIINHMRSVINRAMVRTRK